MRTVGIIAEYNPFHTGHAYHLQKAREVSGADFTVVVMSPDFVQRGEPAVFDKYTRTRLALMGGADLVVELPVCYACGSAEYFAEGAAALLNSLGAVDCLCFGSETDSAKAFLQTASVLSEEPEEYRRHLKERLKQGHTFPKARSMALEAYLTSKQQQPKKAAADCETNQGRGRLLPESFLETPNNILGVEYCKALKKLNASLTPIPVLRRGNGFHSHALDGSYCSATALRSAIKNDSGSLAAPLYTYIPDACRDLFQNACRYTVSPDDFLPYLTQRLLLANACDDILDISGELSDRIARLRYACIGQSWEEIVRLIRTKQMTETRIRRALLHLVLGITTESLTAFRANGTVFYAHVLGFKKDASPLLHTIKQKSTLPLITRASRAASLCGEYGRRMWNQDLYASHLYRSILAAKYQLPFQPEYCLSPVIL